MANLKLTELAEASLTTDGDKLYIVQSNTSKQIALSAFFDNIPVPVNITTENTFQSGGQSIESVLDNRFFPRFTSPVIELNGAVTYPTPGDALSASGNSTVCLSTGNKDYILVTVPLSGQGMPRNNWQIEFVQTGRAKIYVVGDTSGADRITFVGSGSAQTNLAGVDSSLSNILTSHMTSGIGSTLTIKKLDDNNGGNRYLALTASQ